MESFLSGLGLAIVAALGWIAWFEHRTYRMVFIPLVIIVGMCLLLATVFDLGVIQALNSGNYTGLTGQQLADQILRSVVPIDVFLILGAAMLYLFILAALPLIRDKGDHKKVDEKDRSSEM